MIFLPSFIRQCLFSLNCLRPEDRHQQTELMSSDYTKLNTYSFQSRQVALTYVHLRLRGVKRCNPNCPCSSHWVLARCCEQNTSVGLTAVQSHACKSRTLPQQAVQSTRNLQCWRKWMPSFMHTPEGNCIYLTHIEKFNSKWNHLRKLLVNVYSLPRIKFGSNISLSLPFIT